MVLMRNHLTWRMYRILLALAVGSTALVSAQPTTAHPGQVLIHGFPAVKQWYSLSCEYAAAAAVTLYWGQLVSQDDFLREVPRSPNPHLGFRGNIYGSFGGIEDYGVYAEPLVPVLERRGYTATVFYNDEARLTANLRAGNPVVVWLTAGRQARPIYTRTDQGVSFRLVPGEHTVVAYGYDAAGVYLIDVGTGGYYHTTWDAFLPRWSYFNKMALVIRPR